ncbi:hypothetical protein CAPTEDRAFT_209190 [Capitella teleta]|uniref:Uncharacterized protein n=1 Tax=Capitella teleta TaxID=283909 RepID=R7VMD2_CAPTE|nr:hypothetical protein CAPTEDRAFT_209190 [Capitella teleta]|eukprot:ELU18635.1 hypothetical protein CAPTEDRAFT_209190 [Capitella teleta]
MEALILILALWTTSVQCQATWKLTPLTAEQGQRCCVDAHSALLQIAQLKSQLSQLHLQLQETRSSLQQQKQATDLHRQELNGLKEQISGQLQPEDNPIDFKYSFVYFILRQNNSKPN